MSIERKSWKPLVTSQCCHCPAPFTLNTYSGCQNSCIYCFARDLYTFARKNSEHKEFSYLIGIRPDLFKNWVERTLSKDLDLARPEEVAFKERLPLKLGSTSDPFPKVELEEHITYDILKVLNEYDYPVVIQTKNPHILLEYAKDFVGANWSITVSLISTDEEFLKIIEPNSPSANERLEAIRKLTEMGFKVMIKVQPAIYPKILKDLPELIRRAKNAGCWAFNIEGLKIRTSMPKSEQKSVQKIGDYLGIDIREFYRKERKMTEQKCGADFELSSDKKIDIYDLAEKLAKENDIKFYLADNYLQLVGDGCECCGTEALRDYKLLSCDKRSRAFGNDKGAKNFENCIVTFTRSKEYRGKTIREMCDIDQSKK